GRHAGPPSEEWPCPAKSICPSPRWTDRVPRPACPPGIPPGRASWRSCISRARPACSCCTATFTTWSAVPPASNSPTATCPRSWPRQVSGTGALARHYARARGLPPLAGNAPKRLQGMVQHLPARLGEPPSGPRAPENVLLPLARFVERGLLEDDPARRKSFALV